MPYHRHPFLPQPIRHGIGPHNSIINFPLLDLPFTALLQINIGKDVFNNGISTDFITTEVVKQGIMVDLSEGVAA